jgi:hypothetical protein
MIVYAPSYAGLVQALKVCLIEDLIVYTFHPEIINFCTENKIRFVEVEWNRKGGFKNVLHSRKQILNQANKIKNQEVLFCFYGFDVYGLLFIFSLDGSNKVFFHNKDHFHFKETFIDVLKDKRRNKDFLIYRILFNIPLTSFAVTPERKFFGIDEQILKNKFSSLDKPYKSEIFAKNRKFLLRNLKIEDDCVIFMDQGKKRFDVTDESIEWMISYFPNKKIYLKIHPNGLLSNENLLQFEQLPTIIPVELIINEECTVVSICSTSLIDEDIKCKKYSLVNLVKWKDKDNHRRYLDIVSEHSNIQIV